MSAKRLRFEMHVWRGVWQQLVTFLDRIDETAEMDEPAIKMISSLLPVMGVVERSYGRATGARLGDALTCAPRGTGQPQRSIGDLTGAPGRLPGAEDQELAAGTPQFKGDEDEKLEDAPVLLWSTATLFTFRDEKHGEVEVRAPAYDIGPLAGDGQYAIADAMKSGHFDKAAREEAVNSGEDKQKTWSQLRNNRRSGVSPKEGEEALSVRLSKLNLSSKAQDFTTIGNAAILEGQRCTADRQVLEKAEPVLVEAGADDDLISALGGAKDTLSQQAKDYQDAGNKLTHPYQITSNQALDQIKKTLARADSPDGLLGIPLSMLTLDTKGSAALDDNVAMRIAYPDGSLRMLRLMEASLRWQWAFRRRWFDRRRMLVLGPLYTRAMYVFTDNLKAIRQGTVTGAPVSGAKLAKDATTQANTLSITPKKDLTRLQPGQIAILRGDRPTLVTLLGSEIKNGPPGQPSEQLLHITPLNVSLSTDLKVPGISGLAVKGTTLDGGSVSISDDDIRAGASAAGANDDGLPQEVVALGTRLQLILGVKGRAMQSLGGVPPIVLPGRPEPPSIPAPYGTIDHFDVEETVTVGATRLFLKKVPDVSKSGSTRPVMMARPGELMLIRGADVDGNWWQGVIEVARVDILTGDQARAEDDLTGTPTPVCCQADEPVVVISLRELQLPHDLVRNITVSRSFAGFGCASLAARDVIPATLDPETETQHVNDPADGNKSKIVLRDPELRAALKILDGWFGSAEMQP